ncbi:hypothetical protein F9K94_00980 [Brucella tritici]|uniref:Uncharacterized protein n=1 Tax=Brucella tritici TaxID=94626 RepID=A0A7V7VXJ9_9HYPH|nr:hypothetical protein [Brucella tritici]KAB2658805.1 hypothetical protein F9K94_00980 [Brucella tritici]
MQIPNWLTENWALFVAQPTPFVSLAFICFVLGYVVSQVLCRERISTLKERVDLYKEKLDGASPDEASKKLKDMEAKLKRMTALDLDDERFGKIVEYLRVDQREVNIDTNLTSSFGTHLAEQLHEAFQLAGWKVYRSKSLYDGVSVREIVLRWPCDRIKEALKLGEIPFRVELEPDNAKNIPSISFRA